MYCCVPFCKSTYKKPSIPKISFHEFPVDGDLTRQWLRRIARKDFVPNDKSSSSKVCSKHFTPEDFVPCTNSRRSRLKKGAIPTVFPMYPSYALLPPINNSSSLTTLNHDRVKKPPKKKYKKKNSIKEVDPSILHDFEINSTNNKSPDQHNEDRVFINEEDKDQYDSSRLLQTLNHLKRISTENSTKKVATGIFSDSDMTFTNNNSPKPPDVVHTILINEANKDTTALNRSQSIANFNQVNSDTTFTNINCPKKPSVVSACTINVAKKDLSATKNRCSLVDISHMKRLSIMKNKTENSTKKDDTHDLMLCVLEKNREIGNLRTLLFEKDKKLKQMEEKISVYESNDHHKILKKIGALKETSPQSNFILDQMDNFFKKQPTWSESTIRECATWIACSPQGYDFVRERKLMVLPSRKTLLKYAYSGEIKMDNLSSCQEESPGQLPSEISAMEH